MAATITRRTVFQSGDNTLEFIRRPDINRGGTGKAYRVILNGKAVDWAYDDCHTVETIKTAAYFFEKHLG
ncbi:MAG: hypothetical protein IT480_18660 [Gammaproteobacteria bacterium]|nr:hypothetical protein [Gammaproteobacteria bacterium]